ncbi:MAG: hypothetical protein R3323_05860 [Wenzhouxiangellaceae bacterium]|nr:hypothetical protein [Wenzhouxiangellaceae bacterium]
MSQTKERSPEIGGSRWRLAGWSILGMFLLVPLVAMQFTDEVVWTASDFAIMGVLLVLVGFGFEGAARVSPEPLYRAAGGLAVLSTFLLIWVDLAVGVIGIDDNPVNAWYLAVPGTGLLGAILVRGRARGMAVVMTAMAGVQTTIAVIAMAMGLGQPHAGPLEIAMVNGFFVVLFLASAMLFALAAGRRPDSLGVAREGEPR